MAQFRVSHKTPLIKNGTLQAANLPAPIPLDSEAWFKWLEDEDHHSFHFDDGAGGFTARKEKRQRGQWYWVAYRQAHNHLHKVYLGKSETLTTAHLHEAAEALAAAVDREESTNPVEPP